MLRGRSKYGNVKATHPSGIVFDSKRELKRYDFLLEKQSKGLIRDLELQVEYILVPKITEFRRIDYKRKDSKFVEKTVQQPIKYICDFRYMLPDGTVVVEDVKISKKMRPPEYILKKKLFRYYYGFDITEIYDPEQ